MRLPDELVEFIDRRVAQGAAASRAVVVATAVDRERRREIAERDVAILAAARGADPDGFDDLARYAAGGTLEELE